MCIVQFAVGDIATSKTERKNDEEKKIKQIKKRYRENVHYILNCAQERKR